MGLLLSASVDSVTLLLILGIFNFQGYSDIDSEAVWYGTAETEGLIVTVEFSQAFAGIEQPHAIALVIARSQFSAGTVVDHFQQQLAGEHPGAN